jgi:hypothetical protein
MDRHASLSMNTCRHCEQSEAIHDFRRHGLPRYARSDANKTVLARNVVTRQSMCGSGQIQLARNDDCDFNPTDTCAWSRWAFA